MKTCPNCGENALNWMRITKAISGWRVACPTCNSALSVAYPVWTRVAFGVLPPAFVFLAVGTRVEGLAAFLVWLCFALITFVIGGVGIVFRKKSVVAQGGRWLNGDRLAQIAFVILMLGLLVANCANAQGTSLLFGDKGPKFHLPLDLSQRCLNLQDGRYNRMGVPEAALQSIKNVKYDKFGRILSVVLVTGDRTDWIYSGQGAIG